MFYVLRGLFHQKPKGKPKRMWIYILIIFLAGECSPDPVRKENVYTSPPLKVYVSREEVFNPGSSVNLTCGDKTWTETLYVMWNLKLKHKTCKILFRNDGQYINTCNDDRSLRNNSLNQSYIPNISADDVGLYQCEFVYKGGNMNYNINVTLIIPPILSAWLEVRVNKIVAVCRAEGGNPAANISWSLTGNSESVKTLAGSGAFTVQSDLELPEDRNPENLTCIVRHQFWDHEEILVPEVRKGYSSWLWLRVVVVVLVLTGLSFFALKKLRRKCQQ